MINIDSRTIKVGSKFNYNERVFEIVNIKIHFYGEPDIDIIFTPDGDGVVTYEMSPARFAQRLESGEIILVQP